MDWANHRAGSEDTKGEIVIMKRWKWRGCWKCSASRGICLKNSKSHGITLENETRFGESLKLPRAINRKRHHMSLYHSLPTSPQPPRTLPPFSCSLLFALLAAAAFMLALLNVGILAIDAWTCFRTAQMKMKERKTFCFSAESSVNKWEVRGGDSKGVHFYRCTVSTVCCDKCSQILEQ